MIYQNQEIKENMQCDGTLILDHCVIYNPAQYIRITQSLRASHCTFICANPIQMPLFTMKQASTAVFEHCKFIDCTYFLEADETDICVTMNHCELVNCWAFMKLGYDVSQFEMHHTKIRFQSDFQWDENRNPEAMFHLKNNQITLDHINVSADNVKTGLLFDMWNAVIQNSVFQGIQGQILDAHELNNCQFYDCIGGVSERRYLCNRTKLIDNCTFERCAQIIQAASRSTVAHCQFLHCRDSLIFSFLSGGIHIESCEFKHCTSEQAAPIKLNASSETLPSIITQCVFEDMTVKEGYLIGHGAYEPINGNIITVSACTFKQIHCGHPFINQYQYYQGLFRKKKELVIEVSGCDGWE